MSITSLAGMRATAAMRVDAPRLVAAYYTQEPDLTVAGQCVAFGTSCHWGSSLECDFNESHILAITQAICLYRRMQRIDSPLYLGRDTHVVSEPARRSVFEVLSANGVRVMIDGHESYTPTPAVSQATLAYHEQRTAGLADRVVTTHSHNPPAFGGITYDPPHGGPADMRVTAWIEERANTLMVSGLREVVREPWDRARRAPTNHPFDFRQAYVDALGTVIDFEALRGRPIALGVGALNGASVDYWAPIAECFGLDLDIVNWEADPTLRVMSADWDGAIRMGPSSVQPMDCLIRLRNRFELAFAADPDADCHGIVSRSTGLLNSNHYLAVAIDYLFNYRPQWHAGCAVGKTIVNISLIDRVAARLVRRIHEVPVGFKWFVDGLLDGSRAFGGEESAGACFVRQDVRVWTTDEGGILLGLLAAEMPARMDRDPGEQYRALTRDLGEPDCERIDAGATVHEKAALSQLMPDKLGMREFAGEWIACVLSTAWGNEQPIGGIKVITANRWFAARPSGTEVFYKLSAESFKDREHLRQIWEQARSIDSSALKAAAI